MKKISKNISGKIGQNYIECIEQVNSVTEKLNIPYLLIGATARDIIFEYCHNIKCPRMTMDIDIGVNIENWASFSKLESELISKFEFTKEKEKQRLKFKKTFVDLVPFGLISDENNSIIWPQNNNVMSVLGFSEVYKYSDLIILRQKPLLQVRVPSISGLAVLKLLSWKDAFPNRRKDADDLLFIIRNFEKTIDHDLVFDKYISILEEEKFDLTNTCTRLLGKFMADICSKDAYDTLENILAGETSDGSDFNLVFHMNNLNDNFDSILILLKKLKKGFLSTE